MTESSLAAAGIHPIVSSWRQGRLEQKVAQAIVAAAPRSTIRGAVDELVLHLRRQDIPAERGLAIVMDVASHAVAIRPADLRPFETPVDCLALVARWAKQRYARGD